MRSKSVHTKSISCFFISISILILSNCGGGGGGDNGFGDYNYQTPVITPIDGTWVGTTGITLNFDESHTANRYFNKNYELSAKLNDSATVFCGAESISRFDVKFLSGILEFYSEDSDFSQLCLSGEFTDLTTFIVSTDSGDVFDTFTNDRIAVRLDFGVWVSEMNNTEIIFNSPSTVDNDSSRDAEGCIRLSTGEIIPVFGVLKGLSTANRYPPVIEPLFNSNTSESIYVSIIYDDVFTITATTESSQQIKFSRIDTAESFCDDGT